MLRCISFIFRWIGSMLSRIRRAFQRPQAQLRQGEEYERVVLALRLENVSCDIHRTMTDNWRVLAVAEQMAAPPENLPECLQSALQAMNHAILSAYMWRLWVDQAAQHVPRTLAARWLARLIAPALERANWPSYLLDFDAAYSAALTHF